MRRNARRTAASADQSTPTNRRAGRAAIGRGAMGRAAMGRGAMGRGAIGRAVIDALEERRLMSLTITLRQADGTDNVTVTHVGQVVTLDILGTVTGANGDPSQDAVEDVIGSFLSAGVGTSPVAGNLSATLGSNFTASGAIPGQVQDLNGDGNLDVGGANPASEDNDFFARAGGPNAGGTAVGGSLVATLGTVTYTVTSLAGGGETNVNFRPWAATGSENSAVWLEDGAGASQSTSPFQAGTPFHIFTATHPATTTGSVSATAYVDANNNGAKDAGEVPLGSGTVYVDVHDTGSYAAGDPSAVTDNTGAATVANVPPGTYKVGLHARRTGYGQTEPASGGRVHGGGDGREHGRRPAGPFGGRRRTGRCRGLVYDDANGNGTDDAGEGTVGQAVTVYLDENDNGVLDAGEPTAATTSGGAYEFTGVKPGTYIVRDVVPSGYTATQPSGSGFYTETVGIGQAVSVPNFGLQLTTGSVTGTVFDDADGNGTQGTGEAGVAGVRVYDDVAGTGAYVSTDPSTTTGSTGTYTLAGLAAGSDTVRAVLPTAYARQSLPTGTAGYTVAVTANGTVTGKNFGLTNTPATTPVTTGTVTGFVYKDVDGSDSYTTGDTPVAGETVYVDVGGTGTFAGTDPSAATTAAGTFTITGVTPGTYPVLLETTTGQTVDDPAVRVGHGHGHGQRDGDGPELRADRGVDDDADPDDRDGSAASSTRTRAGAGPT